MDQAELSEKIRSRCQDGCAPLLEEGETIRLALWGYGIPFWMLGVLGIPLAPYMLQQLRIAAVTDRNMYVFNSKFGSSAKAKSVLVKRPLAETTASLGEPGGGWVFAGVAPLVVDDQKIYFASNGKVKTIAEQIVEATRAAGREQAKGEPDEPASRSPAGLSEA